MLIDGLRSKRERQVLHDEIANYAREVAGTIDDLDADLTAIAEKHLADDTESTAALGPN